MERKYKFGDRIRFESHAQRNAVASLLMTVGMEWSWRSDIDLVDCLDLFVREREGCCEIHGGPLCGATPSTPSDIMQWTKDMYELLVEQKDLPKIMVAGHKAIFSKGSVKIGCTTVTNDEVREVYKHLID